MRWSRILLGVLLVAMGAGKLADVRAYAAALAAFRVIPDGARLAVAVVWLAAELAGGLLLLAGGRAARAGAALAVAVSLGYAFATGQAFARHLDVRNCTCFGVYLRQRLGPLALLQDAYMLAWSVWVLTKSVAGGAARSRRRSPAGTPARW